MNKNKICEFQFDQDAKIKRARNEEFLHVEQAEEMLPTIDLRSDTKLLLWSLPTFKSVLRHARIEIERAQELLRQEIESVRFEVVFLLDEPLHLLLNSLLLAERISKRAS